MPPVQAQEEHSIWPLVAQAVLGVAVVFSAGINRLLGGEKRAARKSWVKWLTNRAS